MGHSMGGPIAQLVAMETPLAGLVLIGSAPIAGVKLYTDPGYRRYISKLFPKIVFGKPYLPPFEALSTYVYNGMPIEKHRALFAGAVFESGTAAREIIAGSGNGVVKWLCRLFSKPIRVDINKVNCPVLILNGANDRVCSPQIARDLFSLYNLRPLRSQYAQLSILDNFAHWPMYEPGWERSAETIMEWIKRNNIESA